MKPIAIIYIVLEIIFGILVISVCAMTFFKLRKSYKINTTECIAELKNTENIEQKSKIMSSLVSSAYIAVQINLNAGGDYNDAAQTVKFAENMSENHFSQISKLEGRIVNE